jgi:hypothetical protein
MIARMEKFLSLEVSDLPGNDPAAVPQHPEKTKAARHSLFSREAHGRAFLKREAKLGCEAASRERGGLFTSPRTRGEGGLNVALQHQQG